MKGNDVKKCTEYNTTDLSDIFGERKYLQFLIKSENIGIYQ